jgi:hypothetical protein
MKTTSAQPTGNSSSLRPLASSAGVDSRVGADWTTTAKNTPPKTTPVSSPTARCPRALCQARWPTHSSAKPRQPYSAALMARTHTGAGPAGTPAAFTASATPFWTALAAVRASGAASSPVRPSSGRRPLATTRPRATPTQTSSDHDTVLRVSARRVQEFVAAPRPAATSSMVSCSKSPSRIASQATRSSVAHGLLGGVGLDTGASERSTAAVRATGWLVGGDGRPPDRLPAARGVSPNGAPSTGAGNAAGLCQASVHGRPALADR